MFCKSCGEELNKDVKFCNKCGSDLEGNKPKANKKQENNEVLLELKPTFKVVYQFVSTLFSTVFTIIFLILIFGGGYGFYFLSYFSDAEIVKGSVIAILAVILLTCVRMLFTKLQFSKLNYKFYADRVEYTDGFLNISEKEVKYINIKEKEMRQSIVERIFKIGRIRFSSNATGFFQGNNNRNGQGFSGIIIHSLSDIKENFKKVKEIMENDTTQNID